MVNSKWQMANGIDATDIITNLDESRPPCLQGIVYISCHCVMYSDISHVHFQGVGDEFILQQECWIPFKIQTLVVGPNGGTFDLVPAVRGVVEEDEDKIRLVVEPSATTTTFSYAVLIDGPFLLPTGYRLASHIVYVFSDPSQPARSYHLHLPHWYNQEVGQEGSLSFAEAPHTHIRLRGRRVYSFQLKEGGQFQHPKYGSLLVNGHSTLYVLIFKAYREDATSYRLKYSATQLVRKDSAEVEVALAITFASTTWQKVCTYLQACTIMYTYTACEYLYGV